MDWDPKRGVQANRPVIEAVYDYYGNLFAAEERFEWAGMAKLIGASFYAGFLDIAEAPLGLLGFYETTFLRMQKKIFEDQAVMHEAYRAGGMPEIRALRSANSIDSDTVRAWEAIDTRAAADWRDGNRWLLYREQDDIIDYFYVWMQRHHGPEGAGFTYLLTMLGAPSIRGAHAYPVVFPVALAGGPLRLHTPFADGNIAAFPNRWELIELDTLPAYLAYIADLAKAREEIDAPIADRVGEFRLSHRAGGLVSGLLDRWKVTTASGANAHTPPDSEPGGRTIRFDLTTRPVGGNAVRAYANPRRKPFPVEVTLPRGKYYRDRAQLVKLYQSARSASPTRLTIKLPATDFDTAERTLARLSHELSFDPNSVQAWSAGVARPAELGHNYSTRVFTAEPADNVEIEIQLEHHVAEREFIIDVIFSVRPTGS